MNLEKLDVIDVIIRKCSQVLELAIDNNIPTDNICIFINPASLKNNRIPKRNIRSFGI